MTKHTLSFSRGWALPLMFVVAAGALIARQTAPVRRTIPISQWLLLGPLPYRAPAFQSEDPGAAPARERLKFEDMEVAGLRPADNLAFTWHDGSAPRWRPAQAGEEGLTLTGAADFPSCAYLAAYVDVDRWTLLKLTMTGSQAFRVFLDGRPSGIEAGIKNGDDSASADLKLETGKHLLLVKSVHDPDTGPDWTLSAKMILEKPFETARVRISDSPAGPMTISHLLDGPKPVRIAVSADGSLAALTMRRTLPPSDESETWLEIHDVESGRCLQTIRGAGSPSGVQWAPAGRVFSYTTYGKKGGTIRVVDLDGGSNRPVLENVSDLGSHAWSPDGFFLIYSVTEKGPSDRPGVKRVLTMADRQPGWRNRSFLFKLNLKNGARQRLTAGVLSTGSNGFTPDGKRLLVTRSRVDLTQRPYTVTELHEMNLDTLETRALWEGPWLAGAQWVPDGKKLLILGGPSLFGDVGRNNAAGGLPNEYDTQAYLFDPDERKVDPLTKNFDPAVNRAYFNRAENVVYFVVTDRSFVRLYRYDPRSKQFERLFCGVDVIGDFSMARNKPVALYIGSGVSTPPQSYAIDLKKKASRLFLDPGREDFDSVEFGRVETWSFKNKAGVAIDGRIYFPPDFDPNRKYPLIVNYYGGTSPVTRDFGGRYPLNYYAAQGYIVYVLQPSGATGFGQAFSSLHVNDWGQIVADEIIDGVTKFLKEHEYADPERIGCIGASFGGFMTMLLQARSNLFATAIAHAGISSIASYWGEGYWGYLYSAYATANSFPWNRKDLYISQSPLYNADKISTPLLLLHGSVDTNVPPGESTQLFTALKLLGREVEYIQILDQNHHIMTYNKRILWTKTIIAWFDRWLKRQPQWWNELYPPLLTRNEKEDGR